MKSKLKRFLTITASLGLVFAFWATVFTTDSFFGNLAARANGYYIEISDGGPLLQDWSNTGNISADDNWANVIAIEGFRGTGLAPVPGTDPRTILADNPANTLDVNANQTNPATSTVDGVAEFEIANPTIALKGSDSATAPNIVIHLNTLTGCDGKSVNVTFKARDIDASPNNAVSPIAVQYRIGGSGNYTNVFGAYIVDTTTGPNQAGAETLMSATLPNAATGVAQLDVRILTTNAVGADEWIGIDDININCTRPTRGSGTITGNAVDSTGRGIGRAKITAFNMRSQESKIIWTNESGDFLFTELTVGDLYLISVDHKRVQFRNTSHTVQLLEDVSGISFVGNDW